MDESPFTPDDMFSLQEMSNTTLQKMHETYCKPSTNAKETDLKKEEIEAIVKETVANAVKVAVTESVSAALKTHTPALSAEDKAAVDAAKKIVAEKRVKLIADVVANSKMTKEQAEAMPDATLEVFYAALPPAPAPTYLGRAVPVGNIDDPIAKDMATTGVVAHFRARTKKEAA
jgi:hypothetical protein